MNWQTVGWTLLGTTSHVSWWTVEAFVAAILVLDLFDISLPRGDAIAVSAALSSVALMLMGPFYTSVISVAALVFAHVVRRRLSAPRRLVTMVLTRLAGLVAGALVMWRVLSSGQQLMIRVLPLAIPATCMIAELVVAQVASALATSRPFGRLLHGNIVGQAPLLIAEWSASVLLLVTGPAMGEWSLIPVVVLLLLMSQSYSLLLSTRETYRTTVGVLVEAAESQDPRLVGHGERTAVVARSIAGRLGLDVSAVERISYAALLHDVAVISEAGEINAPDPKGGIKSPLAAFRDVFFLSNILPILGICTADPELAGAATEADYMAALIVALSSDVDAANRPGVLELHHRPSVDLVSPSVSPLMKSKVVGAALALGYQVPAVR